LRANYKLQRLFVTADLAKGAAVEASPAQLNYLANVLRLKEGDEVLVFNSRDGEWRAKLSFAGKKQLKLVCAGLERPQTPLPDLHFLFAPLKTGRLDYLVEKAVEMGAGLIQPVITQHTQNHRVSAAKLQINALEAAEQCGILAVPQVREPMKLDTALTSWDTGRQLIFCDEDHATHDPLEALSGLTGKKIAVLIGPEGGFSDEERRRLRSLSFVTPIPLGPRILRADTAAVAALAVVQAVIGDWRVRS
jgi:16S rRNA (uracil1498-N3)-methyltransferase